MKCVIKHLIIFALLGAVQLTQAAEPIMIKATDFSRSHVYTWPRNKYGDPAEHIRKSGNLGSLKGEGTRGFLEYDFNIQTAGWYELSSLPEKLPFKDMEISLDGRFTYPLQKGKYTQGKGWSHANSAGHHYFTQGKHTLRLEIRSLFPPFRAYTAFQLNAVPMDERIRIETTAPFVNEIVARKGSQLPFRAEYSDRAKASILTVKTLDPKSGKTVAATKITLPASKEIRRFNFTVPVEHEGVFELNYELEGKRLSQKSGTQYTLASVDTTPVKSSGAEPQSQVIYDIDCVKTKPDYAGGTNQVVTSNAGTFRESGRISGWDLEGHKETKGASWFAYTFTVPEAETLYKFEFDYPDDAARASHFAVRQNRPGYAKVLGVNSGGEFRTSGKMLTGVLYTWVHEKNKNRIVIIPGGNRMPAAIARIRISKVTGNTLPPLTQAKEGMRRIQYFYEETPSVAVMATGKRFHGRDRANPELMLSAFERFCAQTAYTGATEHLYTAEIYGGGFWPSRYQPCRYTRPFQADNIAKLLLKAEKYSQDCLFDFHCSPMDFHPGQGELYTPENVLKNKSGGTKAWNDLQFMINPIHPDTAKWRKEMLADFANRYKGYQNFKGVRIRNMGWQNNGWSNFHGIDWGYGDYTTGRFEAETGIKIPVSATAKNRYAERAGFLLGQKRKEWLAWRAKKVTELHVAAQEVLRKIRPDLQLLSNQDALDEEKDYGAGIDAGALKRHGITVSRRTFTGRNPFKAKTRTSAARRVYSLQLFEAPEEPAEVERSLHHWLQYYEGPQIVKNNKIGMPKDPGNWWGYAAWPAGRNELEFWALGLARRDASVMTTGTIGYGYGTPIMREFAKEFSGLPIERFTTLAKDPVAIRTYKKWFYAVNSLSVPVKVAITLDGKGSAYRVTDGSLFDVSSFELKPFQLMAFTTEANIKSFSTTAPDTYINEIRATVVPVLASAAGVPALKDISLKLQQAFEKQALCETRMLLEINRPLLEKNGIALPGLYSAGAPNKPESALVKSENKTGTIDGKTLFRDWDREKLLTGKSIRFAFEASASGKYLPQIGFAGGEDFGQIEVLLDGRTVGEMTNSGGASYFALVSMRKPFKVIAGKHRLELRSKNGKGIAVYYVDPVLQFRPVPCVNFRIGKLHTTGVKNKTIREELANPLPGDTDRHLVGPKNTYWTHANPNNDPNVHGVYLGGGKAGNIRTVLNYMHSENDQTVKLMVGADYFWRLTVNGTLVDPAGDQGGGSARPDGKFYTIELKKGWNEILLKIAAGSSGHGLWLSVSDPGGLRFSNRGPH